MNLETLRNNKREHIENCEVKDQTGLNDYQKIPNQMPINLPNVGINRYRLPLNFLRGSGESYSHDVTASMSVSLSADKTGVNMSRFCAILQDQGLNYNVDKDFLKNTLKRFRLELRDNETEAPLEKADLELSFNYPYKQKSLKSDNWGWQYYPCVLSASTNSSGTTHYQITLKYEYSSTCPCSLSMAKQYEKDYAEGKTTEGNGIATAHSQRSLATCTVTFNDDKEFWIDDLVSLLRKALPTETQSLVKRLDEQAFAILNGENPMFVEHASRRLIAVLQEEEGITDWKFKVEHFESLHSHNAVSEVSKSDLN